MRTFRSVEELPGLPDDFWAMLLDLDYVRAFNATAEIEVEVLRFERSGARVERDLRYRSTKPVPALLKPLMPDGIGYLERGVFDGARGRYEHRLEPMPLGARAELTGAITLEPTARGLRRLYEGTVSVRVPVLGAILEREAVAALAVERPESAAVTRAWLAKLGAQRGESIHTPG